MRVGAFTPTLAPLGAPRRLPEQVLYGNASAPQLRVRRRHGVQIRRVHGRQQQLHVHALRLSPSSPRRVTLSPRGSPCLRPRTEPCWTGATSRMTIAGTAYWWVTASASTSGQRSHTTPCSTMSAAADSHAET